MGETERAGAAKTVPASTPSDTDTADAGVVAGEILVDSTTKMEPLPGGGVDKIANERGMLPLRRP